MLRVASSLTARSWKQPRSPSQREQLWCMHSREWMPLSDANEQSQGSCNNRETVRKLLKHTSSKALGLSALRFRQMTGFAGPRGGRKGDAHHGIGLSGSCLGVCWWLWSLRAGLGLHCLAGWAAGTPEYQPQAAFTSRSSGSERAQPSPYPHALCWSSLPLQAVSYHLFLHVAARMFFFPTCIIIICFHNTKQFPFVTAVLYQNNSQIDVCLL